MTDRYTYATVEEAMTDALHRYTLHYASTRDGLWLNDIDWKLVPVAYKDLGHDICGTYSFGRIVLMRCLVPSAVFDVYIHELRHRWQRERNILTYLIGKFYRPLIERDAEAEQEKAAKWIDGQRDLVAAVDAEVDSAVKTMNA